MTLTTRKPYQLTPFDSLFRGLFDMAPWTPATGTERSERWAPMNVFENDHAFVIEVELPGVEDKDIDVKMHDGELTVTAERKHSTEVKKGDFHRVESHFGKMTRTVRLPESVQTDAIEAVFRHGVLTLTVPKAPERTPAKIAVKSA